MSTVSTLSVADHSMFQTTDIVWKHLKEGENFTYPIDYWLACIGSNAATGRVDFLGKWEPNSFCHYHRHLGETTTIVLEGEHHLIEKTATQTVHKTRTAGHYSQSPYGEYHMEHAGDQGSTLFFSMQCRDKYIFEILDHEERVLKAITIEDFALGNY